MNVEKIGLTLELNGENKRVEGYPMSRLLDVLREELRLTGTKEGCGEGECGACSVFLNGELVNSCLVPFGQLSGAVVQTIEGLGTKENLHPVQKAFLEKGGAQCGICTPGMVMASVDLLKKNAKPSLEEVKFGLAGNLCRCTGYMKIFDSVQAAAEAEL